MIEKIVQHIKDFYLFLWEMLKAIPFFFVGILDIICLVIVPLLLLIYVASWIF